MTLREKIQKTYVKPIVFLKGDVTKPVVSTGIQILAHGLSDIGAWGAGVVVPIGKRWPGAQGSYFRFCKAGRAQLGAVDFRYEHGIIIANMITQTGLISHNNPTPFKPEGLRLALSYVRDFLGDETEKARVHMPRIGCGLGGTTWDVVESIVLDELSNWGIEVYVYDLPKKGDKNAVRQEG